MSCDCGNTDTNFIINELGGLECPLLIEYMQKNHVRYQSSFECSKLCNFNLCANSCTYYQQELSSLMQTYCTPSNELSISRQNIILDIANRCQSQDSCIGSVKVDQNCGFAGNEYVAYCQSRPFETCCSSLVLDIPMNPSETSSNNLNRAQQAVVIILGVFVVSVIIFATWLVFRRKRILRSSSEASEADISKFSCEIDAQRDSKVPELPKLDSVHWAPTNPTSPRSLESSANTPDEQRYEHTLNEITSVAIETTEGINPSEQVPEGINPSEQVDYIDEFKRISTYLGFSESINYLEEPVDESESMYSTLVLLAYEPQKEDELELQLGDTVLVSNVFDDGWGFGVNTRTQARGLFPVVVVSL